MVKRIAARDVNQRRLARGVGLLYDFSTWAKARAPRMRRTHGTVAAFEADLAQPPRQAKP